MCGLSGLFTTRPGLDLRAAATRMADAQVHRGPDDSGVWHDAAHGVALSFRRLAIIDLSAAGHQPMASASGRFTLIFNGEIYNHRDLRAELEPQGVRFRGHSDTEVILAAFERWGIEASVRRFVGMFLIAVWDAERRELSLVRDRLGIKPLFVYAAPGLISFGSEIKALVAGPEFDRELDLEAVTLYLRHLYVPAPRSIFRRVTKLLPGHILTLRDPGAPLPESVPYWSAESVAHEGMAHLDGASDEEAIQELQRLVTDAVRLRLESDVPLGALLSGGVDSSTVVAIMQSLSTRPVKTFTIGFDAVEHDEAAHASAVARHLGTDHTELRLTGRDALEVVPMLPEMFDEPLADPSQIPTFLICRLARRDVTVALTGDGGDEVFAGYNRYLRGERTIERARRIPRGVRQVSRWGLSSLSPETWDRLHRTMTPVLPRSAQLRLPGEKLHKLGELLGAETEAAMYLSLLSSWQQPELLVRGGREPSGEIQRILGQRRGSLLDRMMLADQVTYLPDDLLAKVDHASMATSLEARVPLLDHRVVEYSWRLNRRLKIRGHDGKWILRQLLYRLVPRALVEREKVGFTVPTAQWLRGPLRPWAEDLLSPARLQAGGVLSPVPVRRAWDGFLAGRGRDATGLWAVLMFQAWHQRWA